MGMAVLFFEDIGWHYSREISEMIGLFRNLVWFFYHFFSIGILSRTLISPVWRLEEKYRSDGFNPQALFESLVVNLISRIVGVLLRSALIISGLLSEIFLAALFIISFAAWLAFPALIPILFIGGLNLAALDFLQNPAWHKFVARLGIEESSLSEIAPENTGGGSFTDIAASIFEKTNLKNTIIDRNIKISSVKKAAYWAEREVAGEMFSRRWWRREHLARLQGLGKNFAYGETYFLEKFAYDLAPQAEALKEEIIGKDREMELIEKALLKSAGANVLIVGDAGVGKHTLLLGLTRAIYEGKIFPSLEYKQVFKLYAESIIASGKTKGDAEAIIIKLLNETAHAGNIILAI